MGLKSVREMTREELTAEYLKRRFPVRGARPKHEGRVEVRLQEATIEELRDLLARKRYSDELFDRSTPAKASELKDRF